MKTLPPIPPHSERFTPDNEEYRPRWTLRISEDEEITIALDGSVPISPELQSLIAADAEVAWRKEAEKAERENRDIDNTFHEGKINRDEFVERSRRLYREAFDAASTAAAWRSWAEPEPESEEADHAK